MEPSSQHADPLARPKWVGYCACFARKAYQLRSNEVGINFASISVFAIHAHKPEHQDTAAETGGTHNMLSINRVDPTQMAPAARTRPSMRNTGCISSGSTMSKYSRRTPAARPGDSFAIRIRPPNRWSSRNCNWRNRRNDRCWRGSWSCDRLSQRSRRRRACRSEVRRNDWHRRSDPRRPRPIVERGRAQST